METSFMYDQDVSFPVDMVEMGVRPMDWIDQSKNINYDDSNSRLLCNEKPNLALTVFPVELQLFHGNTKVTKNDDPPAMSDEDDDDESDFDIDPETGEKIFRETPPTVNSAVLSPSNKWIEEYLLNLESSSDHSLPRTTTDFNLNDIPSSLQGTEEPDWLSSLIPLDENDESLLLAEPILDSPFGIDHEEKPNLSSSSPTFLLKTNEPHQELFSLHGTSNLSEDDYSTGSSNDYFHRTRRLHSSIESDNENTLVEAKLEKIDPEDQPLSHMMARRASLRATAQGQQDEENLLRYQIPLTLHDITQSSTEEYNQQLTKLSHLSTEQMHIIKDIRRRGKNKIAAQNCRKRKAVGVESLLEEVDDLKRIKHELEARKRAYQDQIAEMRRQYEHLHRQVLPDRQLLPAIIVK